jgi:hypothetical protein
LPDNPGDQGQRDGTRQSDEALHPHRSLGCGESEADAAVKPEPQIQERQNLDDLARASFAWATAFVAWSMRIAGAATRVTLLALTVVLIRCSFPR